MTSAHIDTFANDNLPPVDQQPEFLFTLPELQYPEQLNCAYELLDKHVADGRGGRTCLMAPATPGASAGLHWTYAELQDKANRIARVLVEDMGLVAGNRVLLRGPNNPMLVACWFAVMKAGGIAVTTMPLLRAKELGQIIPKGRITHALCDGRLADELKQAQAQYPILEQVRYFFDESADGLETLMAAKDGVFQNVDTAATDTCLLAFTSGTTGEPKGTMHFHRDVMSICLCFPPYVLRPNEDDIFIGSPPLGFTFGLGGLVLFPMLVGAAAVLLEKAAPALLLDAVREYKATVLFTAPTSYRVMAPQAGDLRNSHLRKCVSAGEALPAATRALWKDATGIEMIDGIGATEMLHIFVSADEAHARPGATGKAVPGYVAVVMNDNGEPAAVGEVGKLAVKGPTGCRYLADARQAHYVKNGWNYTGDAYVMDADGYLHYQARTDDMIISSGYNIASPEVEEALIAHPWVSECGVIGVADGDRGQIVKAFVVLTADALPGEETAKILQDFVKQTVAPYKYPREIAFRTSLPRTESGKLQRFRLRDPQ